MKVTYDDVTVKLTGTDGNAFAIMAIVHPAIARKHGAKAGDDYLNDAMSASSYEELLNITKLTVHVI